MRRTHAVRLLALCLLLLCLPAACAPREESALAQYAPAEEDRLVVYTPHKEEVWWPIVKEFEERTGIWVDVVEGGTNEILERIARESDSPAADVMFGGGVESLASYRDCFTPYACAGAEELRQSLREPEDLWTPFSALPVVLIYNTKLVEPDQLTCWSDLFQPRYQGRVAFADPGVSGSSFTGLVTLLCAVGDDEQTLRAFANQLDGGQLAGSGMVISAVAEGSALVGVTLEETALKAIAAGDDIALVYPSDGTSVVPDASALVRGAAHADNARLFLDFTISREVQQRLDGSCRRSVRQDLEAGPELAALDDIPLVDYDVARASDRHDALLMTWAFFLGGEETT